MSDKYFNTYVDTAVGVIHEYISIVLQLKTQLKIAGEALSEKDKALDEMQAEIDSLKKQLDLANNQSSEMQKIKASARQWEESYNAMANKVSHMDTLTKQYNELKSQYLLQSEELNAANEKIKQLENPTKTPKKVINTKNKEINADDF